MRFLYVYMRVRAVAHEHAAYWRGLGLDGFLGGGPLTTGRAGPSCARRVPERRRSVWSLATPSPARVSWTARG
jgi:hypothetical protein